MSPDFKDHFSDKSAAYSEYRPTYPAPLFAYLSALTREHDRAWDCGTGSGQAAFALADYYREVVATDASRNQISNARRKAGIVYRNESAERSSLAGGSVDLVTVAQALHWFDLAQFGQEADRVMKPGGILAAWTYGLQRITPQLDRLITHLYGTTLDSYWPPERKLVEAGYRDISIPMQPCPAPEFHMQADWNLAQQAGYLRTWSAVRKYAVQTGENPVDRIYPDLLTLWGDPEQRRTITWPLTLRLWRKDT